MGVVVRKYIGILIIIISFPYSTCINTFWQQHPYFFVHLLNVFWFFHVLWQAIMSVQRMHVHVP